jgi:hypothetical protein
VFYESMYIGRPELYTLSCFSSILALPQVTSRNSHVPGLKSAISASLAQNH